MNRRDFFLAAGGASAFAVSGQFFPNVLRAGESGGNSGLPGETPQLLKERNAGLNSECPIPFQKTIRDRLWMWGHDPGSLSNAWGVDAYGGGVIPVADAIRSMGIPNVCMVPFTGTPKPAEYAEYAKQFHHPDVKRFTWSFIHGRSQNKKEIRDALYPIIPEYPNFVGLDMDDFFFGAGDPEVRFDVWLAGNLTQLPEEKRFPVTLTISLDSPLELDRVELMQADWHVGNFRTKDAAVLLQQSDGSWKEVGSAVLPREALGKAEVRFAKQKIWGLQIRISSTYDTGAVCSVGLKRVFAFLGAEQISWPKANVTASSLWGRGEFPARSVLAGWNDQLEEKIASAGLFPFEIADLQKELQTSAPKCGGKKMDLSIVLYSGQLHPAIRKHLELVDVVYFWTWVANDLASLEKNFRAYREIVPKKRTRLGIYMWDFGTKKPISLEMMKIQCDLAHQWLHEGEVEGLIFHCTPLCDMNLDAVKYAKDWIQKHGEETLC